MASNRGEEHVTEKLTKKTSNELTARDRARIVMEAAFDKKAEDVIALHVGPLVSTADYFVIATGTNDRQVVAIVDEIEKRLRKDHGIKPLGIEGRAEGHWVLLDYADVVVHVFLPDVRNEYRLERLWGEAEKMRLANEVDRMRVNADEVKEAMSGVSAETE